MRDQRIEGAGHMTVAEVPRRDLGTIHLVVVLLGIEYESGILLGVELLVLRRRAVTAQVGLRAVPQLEELGDDLVLARVGNPGGQRVPVRLAVGTDVIEARVPFTGPAGPVRI